MIRRMPFRAHVLSVNQTIGGGMAWKMHAAVCTVDAASAFENQFQHGDVHG